MKKSNDDDNKLIASTTIDMAVADKNVIMVAVDTDMLVMVLHFWNFEMENISLLSRKKTDISLYW